MVCKFRSGDFDLNDRERSRCPSVINDTLLKNGNNPKLTTEEISNILNRSVTII